MNAERVFGSVLSKRFSRQTKGTLRGKSERSCLMTNKNVHILSSRRVCTPKPHVCCAAKLEFLVRVTQSGCGAKFNNIQYISYAYLELTVEFRLNMRSMGLLTPFSRTWDRTIYQTLRFDELHILLHGIFNMCQLGLAWACLDIHI